MDALPHRPQLLDVMELKNDIAIGRMAGVDPIVAKLSRLPPEVRRTVPPTPIPLVLPVDHWPTLWTVGPPSIQTLVDLWKSTPAVQMAFPEATDGLWYKMAQLMHRTWTELRIGQRNP